MEIFVLNCGMYQLMGAVQHKGATRQNSQEWATSVDTLLTFTANFRIGFS